MLLTLISICYCYFLLFIFISVFLNKCNNSFQYIFLLMNFLLRETYVTNILLFIRRKVYIYTLFKLSKNNICYSKKKFIFLLSRLNKNESQQEIPPLLRL